MRIVALITALVYVWFLSKPLVNTVDFFVNQEEITEELCENKDEPVLECNGKCYLMKTLEQEENPFETKVLEEDSKEKKQDKKETKTNSKLYEVIPNGVSIAKTYKIVSLKNFKPYIASASTLETKLLIPPPKA